MVALRGSLPADALTDFRQVFSQYGRLRHSQKAQIAEIFQELQQPRWKLACTFGMQPI